MHRRFRVDVLECHHEVILVNRFIFEKKPILLDILAEVFRPIALQLPPSVAAEALASLCSDGSSKPLVALIKLAVWIAAILALGGAASRPGGVALGLPGLLGAVVVVVAVDAAKVDGLAIDEKFPSPDFDLSETDFSRHFLNRPDAIGNGDGQVI